MSSPLGGFYLGAINRRKAELAAHKAKVPLMVMLKVTFEAEVYLDQTVKVSLDQSHHVVKDKLDIKFQVDALTTQLWSFNCELAIKSANQLEWLGKQQLNLEPGETITTLVAGDDRVKLTVSVSKD